MNYEELLAKATELGENDEEDIDFVMEFTKLYVQKELSNEQYEAICTAYINCQPPPRGLND